MPTENSGVATLSVTMARLSACGFVLLPLCVICVFLLPEQSQWLMFNMDHLGAELNSSVPFLYRVAALGCALGAAAFTMWALWSLRRLFLLYAQGSVFSGKALSSLNQVATALFASVVVGFISQAPISFFLTWSRGAHNREISLSFGTSDVATLFIAGVVLVIARVMAEAQRVADENAKFV